MFLCPKCKSEIKATADEQCKCGFIVPVINNIIQLTDLPDKVLDSDGDKYIGYEHIGTFYSGYDGNPKLSEEEIIKANAIADEIRYKESEGTLLDIGCGDGFYSIPLLSVGVNVIAGDISNKMMSILNEKVFKLGIDASKLKLCRMNALCIPLKDESVDGVIANSMLHLNSNPQKIINEISRVLKKGGKYICFEDHPKGDGKPQPFDNREYNLRINNFHKIYWTILNKNGIQATRYSWNFDRDKLRQDNFTDKKEKIIVLPHKEITTPFSIFLQRINNRGFSDQSAVPDDLHKIAFDKTVVQMKNLFGDNFDKIDHKEWQNDLDMTVYIK